MNNTKCSFCQINPRSHSFREIPELDGTTQNIRVFYSRPAEAELYRDTASVVHHFECELSGVEEWEWIFDCAGMGMGHYTQFGLVIDLCRLFKKQGRIQQVKIINSCWLINLTVRCARLVCPELPAISTHPDGN